LLNRKEDYHVHCNYNDHSALDLTIENVIERAEKIGLITIAFTEHVRKTSAWTEKYLSEIDYYSKNSKLNILKGFEAKILADGSIDCPAIYENQDFFIIASFHTKYADKDTWLDALLKVINNKNVNVIGHLAPEDEFVIDKEEIMGIAHSLVANNKIVELNAKYRRPPIELLKIFKDVGVRFHLGSDAHSLKEIGEFDRINHLINFLEQ
jgi:putative hydrolase